MKKYRVQKNKDHYFDNYNSPSRFISYYNQQKTLNDLIIAEYADDVSMLEIGKGNGFLSWYLQGQHVKINIKTFDIAEDLNPDFVGDLVNIDSVVKEKFDIICCFETLEHLEFEDLERILDQIALLTKRYFVFSVPQTKLYLSAWFKLPMLRASKFFLNIPFPIKHKFDGEHYWVLGRKGYSEKILQSKLEKSFVIKKNYTDPLAPYHRFFVLEKK